MSTPSLVDRLLAHDPRAIARALSLIEDESDQGAAVVSKIHGKTGRAYLIGVTGPPGAGKSTLVDKLTAEYRKDGKTVGVLCVDPTSPYTGGAILGDRVRMQAHAQDDGVFIRSMATRGHLGGLARTTSEAALVLDAAGYDVIIIETVGVGQDEVDIVRTADIAIVTLVPGTGDDVQALKAGIMEIADIFVVNKADREGADRTAASIEAMLSLDQSHAHAHAHGAESIDGPWRPPVLRTEATTGRGVPELRQAIETFRTRAAATLGERRRSREEWRLRDILSRQFMRHIEHDVLAPGEFEALIDAVSAREIDPYAAASRALRGSYLFSTDSGRSGSEVGGAVRPTSDPKTAKSVENRYDPLAAPIDHVGIAVADATAMVDMFARLFGLATGEPETIGAHRVRFVETGEATIEIVEPASADSPIAKFLEKRGAGLHHVCLRVADIDAALARLRERGVRLIDEAPRAGAHGSRIAFVHPSSACGLLIELKQLL